MHVGSSTTELGTCAGPAAADWDGSVIVDPGSASYSSVAVRHPAGPGSPKLYDLWAWSNDSSKSPNQCIFGGGGVVPRVPKRSGDPFLCKGGIRYAEVGFPEGIVSP